MRALKFENMVMQFLCYLVRQRQFQYVGAKMVVKMKDVNALSLTFNFIILLHGV